MPDGKPILTKVKDRLELDLSNCRGYDFRDALDKIREVTGRQFDYDRKVWMVEATPDNAERILLTIQPEASQELHSWVRQSKTKASEALTTPLPDDAKLLVPWATERQSWQPETVNDETFLGLLPYQRAAVDLMADRKRILLADDMGLGKTFEAISAVEEHILRNGAGDGLTFPTGPRLVVAPNSVKGSWGRELRRWLNDPPLVMADGSTPAKRHDQIQEGILNDAWVIVNWEQLRVKREKIKVKRRGGGEGSRTVTLMKEPLFEFPSAAAWELSYDEWTWKAHAKAKREKMQGGWLAELADEIHRAKNKKALQTQGLHRTQAQFMVGLTGTPLMNSPDELWSILHWLYPMEYTSYWEFFERYVDYYENPFQGRVITGVKNPDALRFELKGRLIRRTASILGLKGRKRIYYTVPLNPGQRKVYEDAEREMWLEVERAMDDDGLNALHKQYEDLSDKFGEDNEQTIEARQVYQHAKTNYDSAKRFATEASKGATLTTLVRIPNGAARMTRLLQIIENAALVGGEEDSAIMDDFEQKFEDGGPDAQWVVGFKYRESVEILARRLRKHDISVGIYTGSIAADERTRQEDKFQKGEIQVMLGTLDAMKEGITLTAAHMMYMGSRFFVPDLNEQFEARCDRLGQQELVRVFIPQAEKSVATDKVEPINRVKEKIVRAVIPKDEIKEAHS